jgi:hypothetical protein
MKYLVLLAAFSVMGIVITPAIERQDEWLPKVEVIEQVQPASAEVAEVIEELPIEDPAPAYFSMMSEMTAKQDGIESKVDGLASLTQELAQKLDSQPVSECKCDCDCPTVEQIADAVESRLRPLLVVANKQTGETRKVGMPVTSTDRFELNPGEILTGVELVPGSGIIHPVTNGQVISRNGMKIQQYSTSGYEIRTAPTKSGGIIGQVRQTCQQVWNSRTQRFETRCSP